MRRVFFLVVVTILAAGPMSAVTIDLVPVGDPGNPNDPSDGDQNVDGVQNYGAVDYSYSIGKYEVTNEQYAEFLNSVAATDTYGLYHTGMGSDDRAGIIQSGSSGSYTYSVKPNMGDKPVNYIRFYDAVRFVNWLENGQPAGAQGAGTTETGSYTLFTDGGATTNVSARVAGTTWVIPTENEWYKAAYYDPTASGTTNYWLYPTRSDSAPTAATANAAGDISNPGANVANYNSGADWNGQNGNVTTVGSAGPLSASYYGTYDQGGNVWEWNEQDFFAGGRGRRGGFWFNIEDYLQSHWRSLNSPDMDQDDRIGFRVAFMIPEPSCFGVVLIAAMGLCVWRMRRRA